ALLRRRPLVSFFVLAFAWTWAFVIVFLILFPLPDIDGRTLPGDFGPLIAAIVMSGVVIGRSGIKQLLRRMVQWRVGLVWYAFALVGVPLLYIASIMVVPGALGSFKAPDIGSILLYPVLYVGLLIIGGPLAGTVVLGLLWAAWHLPNYFRPDWSSVNGQLSFSGVAVFFLAAVSFSVIITWVYNHTGGSILMAILVHASINFSQGLTGELFPAAKNNEVAPVIAFVALALVLVVATRGRLGYAGHEPVPSATPASSAP